MTVELMIVQAEWDRPFFKRLANNDTGSAPGHQAGVVIPTALRQFFPALALVGASATNPTSDVRLRVELYMESLFLGSASSRYQFQTWGGTRPAESRLTDQLAPLRNRAAGGDLLVIQRAIEDLQHYRLILIRKSSAEFHAINAMTSGRNWGVLGNEKPITASEYQGALKDEQVREASPFELFDTGAGRLTSFRSAIARGVAFRTRVVSEYKGQCTLCGTALVTPEGLYELEAAHIVPRSVKGADDVRNGVCLCRRHHWAFDHGLVGVDPQRRIVVPNKVQALSANLTLSSLHGQRIREAGDPRLIADPAAFQWHFDNVVFKYL